jgi:hypothetical protein|tara:strand:- start:102 stop:359 length:258 start_codon:yes stop_codon:yes gene_type:complete
MTSVELYKNTSPNEIKRIAGRLVKEGLCVATKINGHVQKYFPSDKKEREELVRLSFQKKWNARENRFAGANLLMYSNTPNQIREF